MLRVQYNLPDDRSSEKVSVTGLQAFGRKIYVMNKRENFLDVLRTAATCAVVMLHTVTGVMDTVDMGAFPHEKKVFLIILDLVCWCVPVFLMISGYLFLAPDKKTGMGKMLKKYCRRIFLALLVFGVPYALLEQIAVEHAFRWNMAGQSFVMVLRGESWSHLWYLYLILALYLLTPAMKWVLARVPEWTVRLLLVFLFLGSSALPWLCKLLGLECRVSLPDGGIYIFYYLCGYLFAVNPAVLDSSGKRGKGLAAAAVLLAVCMAGSRLDGSYALQMAYNYPFTVLLSVLIFAAFWYARPGSFSGFWGQAAALSFGVYLIHPVFINLAYKFFRITPLAYPVCLSLPAFFLGTLVLASSGAWVLYKIPLLRRYII